ncbi:hypothetical protein [Salibacterium qingdaonense]|uniref:Phosphodiester glycosidase domain-containing protein n=1 Tax=Salibacterium qingdaonense TaxID=266892 RepID=A0A1I4P456_9BACI|nr:hypothetical protein [Salibacterium qingdaonense]SFM22435.1 hypothetical protein SAMN04488054_1231 [Salibacterium qingdaonense]
MYVDIHNGSDNENASINAIRNIAPSGSNVTNAIGGNSFGSADYQGDYGQYEQCSMIGKDGNFVVMIVTNVLDPRTIPQTLEDLDAMGYDPSYFVHLDGGGSATLKDGFYCCGGNGRRRISNMVAIMDA